MRYYCPQCYRKYEDLSFDTCPEDGARLYALTDKRDDPLLGTVVDERFRIEEILGEGGMGAVYKATQLSVHREVALKILRPDLDQEELFLERFFREARVVAGLTHPNIVELIDFGQDRDTQLLFLVMELVRGTDMAGLLKQGRLAPAMALDVVYQTCAGLTEPHSRGIVHRDLKPDNIILLPISDGSFQVKLLDFGIARSHDRGTRLTQTGMICGTPAYMSPEQAQNTEVTAQTDLYSLGVVLFEMLTGHLPFAAVSGLQLLIDHVQRPAPKLSMAYSNAFPEEISSLVADLLEKDPAKRPASARAVRRRVQKIRKTLDLPAVILTDEDSVPADDGPEALFTPWLLPSFDTDAPAPAPTPATPTFATPPHQPSPWSETTDAAPDGAPSEAAAPESSPNLAGHSAPPSALQPATQSASSQEPNDAKPGRLITIGASVAATLIAAMTVAIINLWQAESDISNVETTGHSMAPQDESTTAASDDDGADENMGGDGDENSRDDGDGAENSGTDDDGDDDPENSGADHDAPGEPEAAQDAIVADQDRVPPQPTPLDLGDRRGDETVDAPQRGVGAAATNDDVAAPDRGGATVHEGMLAITTAAQAEAAQSLREVTGGILIQLSSGGPTDLELPRLERVGGALTLTGQAGIESLSLPALTEVDGTLSLMQLASDFEFSAPQLETISEGFSMTGTALRALNLEGIEQIGGMVTLNTNVNLESLSLPNLTRVGGMFMITESPSLRSLNAPDLQFVGGQFYLDNLGLTLFAMDSLRTVEGSIILSQTPALERISLARLETVGMGATDSPGGMILSDFNRLVDVQLPSLQQVNDDFLILSSPQLTRLELNQLRQVGGTFNITDNQSLQRLRLGELDDVGGDLMVNNNRALTELVLHNLTSAGDVRIINNGRLSICTVQTIIADLEALGWTGEPRTANNRDEDC